MAELFIQLVKLLNLDANQGGTHHNCCKQTCSLACTDLLMKLACYQKYAIPTYLYGQNWPAKKVSIFKPAELHNNGMLVYI